MALQRLPGELVARGTRSSIRAYGRGAVVKIPHRSTPDGWIESEAQYADDVRAVGAPVPRLLGMERVSGRTASVWEHVRGSSMWQRVVDRPDQSAELGRMLADVQCGLLELVPPVTLPRQRDRLVAKIRLSAATVDASLIRALDLIPAGVSPPQLCHGDLHPSNVILSDGGPVIVDWFDASRGDPVADIARTSMTLLNDGATPPRHLPGSDTETLATLTRAYLSHLRLRLEFADTQLAEWQAIQAVARIAEGVPRDSLLEVWRSFARANPPLAAQAASN
jgi:aminoglycoside phosphotransferase (APT) family kinase protein